MKSYPFFAMANKVWRSAKLAKASPGACWLWVRCISYASDEATDGVIDAGAIKLLGASRKDLADAVKAGLLEPDGAGFRVHDYLEHQTSAAIRATAEESKRERTRERVARWRGGSRDDVTPPAPDHVTQKGVTRSVTSNACNAPVTGEEKKRRREDLPDHERAKDGCPRGAPSEPDELARSEVRRVVPESEVARLATDWTPTPTELSGIGAPSGAPAEYVADQLLAFRGHFCPLRDQDTHHGWCSRFTAWVGRGWARDRTRWRRERDAAATRGAPLALRRGPPQPSNGQTVDDIFAAAMGGSK